MFGKYKVIALCITHIHDERNFNFVCSLNDALNKLGYKLFVYHTCYDLYENNTTVSGEKSIFDLMDYNVIDCILIFNEAFLSKDVINDIKIKADKTKVPVISIGAIDDKHISFMLDYEDGFEKVVRHIIEYHKVSDVHFVAGRKNDTFSDVRINVFKKILAENNIEYNDEMLSYGDYWSGPTQTAIEKLIAENRVPEAIICANDTMAITVCTVLQSNGYAVPDDVIVSGFEEAQFCSPSITTCICDYKQMADEIANELKIIFNGTYKPCVHILPCFLSISDSCGCVDHHPVFNKGDLLLKDRNRFHRYQDDERQLYEMSSRILNCNNLKEFTLNLSKFNFYSTCIFINNECLDTSLNPSVKYKEKTFEDDMCLLYKTESPIDEFPKPFKLKNILPDIDYIFTENNPIIFNALSFVGIPLGYVCFHFAADIENYCKIPQYVTAINNSIGGYRNIQYQRYMINQIDDISKHDFLTGLYNRSGFYDQLDRMISNSGYNLNQRIIVSSIDLDGLKNINDKFGHDDGDHAIKSVAKALKSVDLNNKICARFGGDEFVLCAPITDEASAKKKICDSINSYLDNINSIKIKEYTLSVSIGAYSDTIKNFNFDFCLQMSDKEMYNEKIKKPFRRKN